MLLWLISSCMNISSILSIIISSVSNSSKVCYLLRLILSSCPIFRLISIVNSIFPLLLITLLELLILDHISIIIITLSFIINFVLLLLIQYKYIFHFPFSFGGGETYFLHAYLQLSKHYR